MTPPSEQMLDLASDRRRLQITAVASPVYELMLTLWTALGDNDRVETQELGVGWFEEFAGRISPDVRAHMEAHALDHGFPWIGFLGMMIESGPDTGDSDAILAWLRSGIDVRATLLRDVCWDAPEDALQAAIEGDEDALEKVMANAKEHWRPFFRSTAHTDPAELGAFIADVIEHLIGTERAIDPQWVEARIRSAEDTNRWATHMRPSELIERVTNGIAYDVPHGISRLVFVPSVTLRPWSLVTEFGTTLMISHPVAEEYLELDPTAPPAWIVSVHKALGDDRRLRILHRLSGGPAGLAELTEVVGLAKSTVFHHIGVLRGAGLIRVHLGPSEDSPVYELRRSALDDAHECLSGYLGGPPEAPAPPEPPTPPPS